MRKSNIPTITADLITATALIGGLRTATLPTRCRVVQSIADHGKAVDELTVGELLQLAKEAQSHEGRKDAQTHAR
ncbi:hypothetical protein [Xanthomonas sp. CFBP 8445]|uniref:hypothetical protein n=1 Tax=Xanthomonas sp. CFBP 8445 TaxID=2971236 RepID=UPI0021DF860B|nr:hypothetical protein [Xanthomonas sp. CFBP 8445]UYC12257.1 hypothetical protein NUG21_00435 [Xanthomonas sp. CFBP 8445]